MQIYQFLLQIEVLNIKGVVTQVYDHGGYKDGTKVGLIKGYLSRNQIEFCESETVNASDVPESELSLRVVASKLSMSGGQRFFHCNCKNDSYKTSRCKCRKYKVLCISRCHQSLSCTNKQLAKLTKTNLHVFD